MDSQHSNIEKAVDTGAGQFEHLVSLYYEPLFRFAMSLTRAEDDAGDLVQDTFMTWATKGHQLRESGKVKSWLFTTLHRRYLETQRRSERTTVMEIEPLERNLPPAEPEGVNRLEAQELLMALGRLEPQFQAAVALFYLEDYSYQEIAQILEIPLGTVKSRISRGIVQLRALLVPDEASNKPAREEDIAP